MKEKVEERGEKNTEKNIHLKDVKRVVEERVKGDIKEIKERDNKLFVLIIILFL